MAEETTDEEAEAAAKAAKKKKLIGLVVVAGLLYQFVLKGSPPPEDEALAEQEAAEMVPEEGEIAPLEELVVNLADQDELHYLRVGVAAVLSIDFALADVEPPAPEGQRRGDRRGQPQDLRRAPSCRCPPPTSNRRSALRSPKPSQKARSCG